MHFQAKQQSDDREALGQAGLGKESLPPLEKSLLVWQRETQ